MNRIRFLGFSKVKNLIEILPAITYYKNETPGLTICWLVWQLHWIKLNNYESNRD